MKTIITTSWDDGYKLDLRITNLLSKYNLKGTFYVSQNYVDNRLSQLDIKDIAKKFEIGAHTLNHPDLTNLNPQEVKRQIFESKQWLENVTNKEINMFCYPYGYYNKEIINSVKEAGFLGARTTLTYEINLSIDSFLLNTSINVYPFPINTSYKKIKSHGLFHPVIAHHSKIHKLNIPLYKYFSWESLAKSIFDQARISGHYFHIWGHAGEIEEFGMWESLENVFKYISNRNDCVYSTNFDTLNNL